MENFDHTRPEPCNIGLQYLPGKTYEKKLRRKTRKDRYDPKKTPIQHGPGKGGASDGMKKPRDAKVKKRRHGRRGLEDQFIAPNVSQNRLTVGKHLFLPLF